MIAILRSGQVIEAPTLADLFALLRQIKAMPRAIIKRGKA